MSSTGFVPTRACCGRKHLGNVCPDGLVMCCLCFDRFRVVDLARTPKGQPIDVCKQCDAREKVCILKAIGMIPC